ncbi:hypothetical protein [Actinoplanes sp. NPDC049316]|uniref:hypothetical protein n=1 Tax=Actinoplanes sp. NPDC049316 TaxID=3154727 RepID=UPI00342D57D5
MSAHLVGAWIFAAVAVVVFAWLTAGPYARHILRPLPSEADTTLRDCRAVPACAPDAAHLVNQQVSILAQARTLTYISAWSVALLAAVLVAVSTVLHLSRRYELATRLLGVAWKVQAVWAAVLLLAQAAVLGAAAHTLAGIPEAARMFTATKAFEAPFTDAGNLYYFAWFIVVGSAAAAVTRTLSSPDGPRGSEPTAEPAQHQ